MGKKKAHSRKGGGGGGGGSGGGRGGGGRGRGGGGCSVNAVMNSPRLQQAVSREDHLLQSLLSIADAAPEPGEAQELVKDAVEHMIPRADFITCDGGEAFQANLTMRIRQAEQADDTHEVEVLSFIESIYTGTLYMQVHPGLEEACVLVAELVQRAL